VFFFVFGVYINFKKHFAAGCCIRPETGEGLAEATSAKEAVSKAHGPPNSHHATCPIIIIIIIIIPFNVLCKSKTIVGRLRHEASAFLCKFQECIANMFQWILRVKPLYINQSIAAIVFPAHSTPPTKRLTLLQSHYPLLTTPYSP
jgi:hypothetical protein